MFFEELMRLYSHALTFKDALFDDNKPILDRRITALEKTDFVTLMDRAVELGFVFERPVEENEVYKLEDVQFTIQRICRRCETERDLVWLRIWISISAILVLCGWPLFLIYKALPDVTPLQRNIALISTLIGEAAAVVELVLTVIKLLPKSAETTEKQLKRSEQSVQKQ